MTDRSEHSPAPDEILDWTCGAQIERYTVTRAHRIFQTAGRPTLAGDRELFWDRGCTLRVFFLAGDPWARKRVEDFAREWEEYADLTFHFGSSDDDAEIRITFEPDRDQSVIGREAYGVPAGESTMNLGSVDKAQPVRQQRAAVLHEFGHALGCIHEHQTEGAQIPWNREKVYAHFRKKYGWSRKKVRDFVFAVYADTMVKRTNFDPASIMIYPIPAALTDGKLEVPETFDLSSGDKSFIAEVYGPPRGRRKQPPTH